MIEKTDEELVRLSLKNPDDFLYLARRYEDKLMRYIIRISGVPKEDAEDILQEVLIKAYRNLNDFDEELKFSSWIYRITHNQVVSDWRKKKARPESAGALPEDLDLARIVSAFDSSADIDSKLTREAINRILDAMDPKYREALVLRYFEEKDYAEISDILKKPMGTVATLVSRAKERFKTEMQKQGVVL